MKIIATCITLLFLTSIAGQESAVKVYDTIQTTSKSALGGELAMVMDRKIKQLLQSKEKSTCTVTRTITKKVETYTPQSQVDICRVQPKVRGIKIQIGYTKDRDEANKLKAAFKRSFPGIDAEMSYRRPDYRVLVGNYFNKRSAGQDLRKIKKKFPAALPTVWRVWCRKAR